MTKMSAKRHLKELQWRFMLIALFFVAGAVLAYQYRDTILPIFLAPLGGQTLIYLTPGGGFTFALLVSVYAGLALAFPVLLQQLYAFLGPALPEKARKKSAIILVCSLLLLVAGILFGYFVAVPSALHFLYGFADGYVESALTADSYTNFVVAYTIGIGIVFQIPLLLLLMHAVKPLKPGGLMKSQKWVILGAFIVAAILTPTPDPVNQAIMAGPVIVVYQLGVIAVLISIYKASRQRKSQERRVQKANQLALTQLAHPSPAIEAEATALAFEEAPISTLGTPVLAAESLAFEENDTSTRTTPLTETLSEEIPLPDPLLEQALEAEVIADQTPAPALIEDAPIPEPLAFTEKLEKPVVLAKPLQKQVQVIDGFVRRPAVSITVPQRPAQPQRPAARPIAPAPAPGPARGLYVDGFISPRIA